MYKHCDIGLGGALSWCLDGSAQEKKGGLLLAVQEVRGLGQDLFVSGAKGSAEAVVVARRVQGLRLHWLQTQGLVIIQCFSA